MFRIGQKVVCVNDGTIGPYAWNERCDKPVRGSIYTVREIGQNVRGPGLKLNELVYRGFIDGSFHEDGFFRAIRFRPIVEKSTDTGMAILREILDRESFDVKKRERA